jgi:uncharacterized protein YbcI
LTLPGLELRPLGRPARSESVYRLLYPGSYSYIDRTELKNDEQKSNLKNIQIYLKLAGRKIKNMGEIVNILAREIKELQKHLDIETENDVAVFSINYDNPCSERVKTDNIALSLCCFNSTAPRGKTK